MLQPWRCPFPFPVVSISASETPASLSNDRPFHSHICNSCTGAHSSRVLRASIRFYFWGGEKGVFTGEVHSYLHLWYRVVCTHSFQFHLISSWHQPAFNDLHGDEARDSDAQSAEVAASRVIALHCCKFVLTEFLGRALFQAWEQCGQWADAADQIRDQN